MGGERTFESHLTIAKPYGRRRMVGQIDSTYSVIMSNFNCICRKNFLWKLRKDIWIMREENKNNCGRPDMKPNHGAPSGPIFWMQTLSTESMYDIERNGRSECSNWPHNRGGWNVQICL